jgi:hypothetical protein
MEPLFHFVLVLIAAGFPWLAGVLVIAIGLRIVGPIRLSIGDRSGRQKRARNTGGNVILSKRKNI